MIFFKNFDSLFKVGELEVGIIGDLDGIICDGLGVSSCVKGFSGLLISFFSFGFDDVDFVIYIGHFGVHWSQELLYGIDDVITIGRFRWRGGGIIIGHGNFSVFMSLSYMR